MQRLLITLKVEVFSSNIFHFVELIDMINNPNQTSKLLSIYTTNLIRGTEGTVYTESLDLWELKNQLP